MMERVIRGGLGLLLALTLPIRSAQGGQPPADDRSAFDVVPRNAARAVLLHAAAPERDTVHCCLSIEAGQPRARGDYEIVLSSNQYTDRTPTIVSEEGTSPAWIRSTSSGSWSNGMATRICRHFYRFSPAKKGEYRLRCRDLSFDGVAYDGVLTIQVGAPELNAVPSFLLWVAGIGCLLLAEILIRIGCRNEARGDTADFIRRHRRLPLNAEGIWIHYLLPIMLLYLPLFLALITLTGMVSISTNVLLWIAAVCVPVAFVLVRLQYRRLFFRWRKTVLPPERIDALLRELAEQYDWTIDHMDRDFFVAHTHPAWWSATWGEQIFVAHDRGGIWINSINDLNKRSSIVSFGYNRRNIRRVTEAIAAQEKETHSFTDLNPTP
ncbi:hypothetical protein [Alistipes putredinis]|uniref:hypothetical protein n=1 Tax=Alistipes putredinis TaxID=28117 RepID=UPI003AB8F7CF